MGNYPTAFLDSSWTIDILFFFTSVVYDLNSVTMAKVMPVRLFKVAGTGFLVICQKHA